MENITLLPARANSTLYKANRKECLNGCIVLEDRITDYCLSISDTTSITIDTSLLNIPINSSIEFNLTIVSNKDNVINFTGFDIDQLEVHRGESLFKVRKILGSENWNIEIISLSGYELEWIGPLSTSTYYWNNYGLYTFKNLYRNENGNDDPFGNYAIGTITNYWSGVYAGSGNMRIEMMMTAPTMLKIFYTNTRNDSVEHWRFPTNFVWYGSNDQVNWTQILNTGTIRYSQGSTHKFEFDRLGFFKFFKVELQFRNTTSGNYRFGPMSLYGYKGNQKIKPGGVFKPIVPMIFKSQKGYNLVINSDELTNDTGRWYYLTDGGQGDGSHTYMTRTDWSTYFKILYVLPKPKRIYGFTQVGYTWETSPRVLQLFGSNDGLNWIEIYKKDILEENGGQGVRLYQRRTHWIDSKKEYLYYKIHISYLGSYGNILRLIGLIPQTIEDGEYKHFDSIIPIMSSNTQDGYLLISSHSGQGDAFKLFNGSDADYGGGNFQDGNWNVIIGLPQPEVVRGLWFKTCYDYYGRMPKNFKLQGSQNMATWTDIQEFSLNTCEYKPAHNVYCEIGNDTAYSYYRFYVTGTFDHPNGNGDFVRFKQLGLSTECMEHNINWFKDAYLVPCLWSNNQDGYTITAQSYYSNNYAPWKAFNRNVSNDNGWAAADSARTNANKECNTWIQIQVPESIAPNSLYLHGRTRCEGQAPVNFTLNASNDGETWTTLLTQTEQYYTEKTWVFENETDYLYFRLNITKTNEANSHISIGALNLLRRVYTTEPVEDDFIEYENQVPNLTSNSYQGYEVSADSIFGNDYPAWKAFNDSGSWVSKSNSDATTSRWVQIYSPEGIKADKIVIQWHENCYSIDYVIEGSNDGENYTTVVSVTGYNGVDLKPEFSFDLVSYKYWRVRSTRLHNVDGNIRMEIEKCSFYLKKDKRQAIKSTDEYLIPEMTANITDGYEATASSYLSDDTDYYPYKAFTRKIGLGGDAWFGDLQSNSETFACDEWLQIHLPVAKVCNKIIMINPVNLTALKNLGFPKDFTFEGSNDGETWDILLTETNQKAVFIDPNIYEFDNETAYSYYRLSITKTVGQYYPGVGQLFLLKREIPQPIEEEEEIEEGGENENNEGEGENNGEINNEGEGNENEGE